MSRNQIVTPQLAVYEIANAIWKQEHLLKKIADGKIYLGYFYGLIDSGKIAVVYPNKNLIYESYVMARANDFSLYDSIFICLALKLGLNLKTLDKRQAEIFDAIKKKKIP